MAGMFDLFDGVSKADFRECMTQAASENIALVALLLDKGIFTIEEWEATKVRCLQELDQALKAKDNAENN